MMTASEGWKVWWTDQQRKCHGYIFSQSPSLVTSQFYSSSSVIAPPCLVFFLNHRLYNGITGDVLSHKHTHALQGFCVVGYRPGINCRLERVCAVSSADKHAVWRAAWWLKLFLYSVLIISSSLCQAAALSFCICTTYSNVHWSAHDYFGCTRSCCCVK